MSTLKKLRKQREARRLEREESQKAPTFNAKKWAKHSREMSVMLKDIDPERFERLAAGEEL